MCLVYFVTHVPGLHPRDGPSARLCAFNSAPRRWSRLRRPSARQRLRQRL